MKPKLMSLFLIVGLLPLLFVSWFTNHNSSNALMDSAQAQLQSVNEIKKAQIEFFFQDHQKNVKALVESISTLREEGFNKLIAVRETKKSAVERYIQNIINQIITFSEQQTAVTAMKAFDRDYKQIIKQNALSNEQLSQMRTALDNYFSGQFLKAYHKKNGTDKNPIPPAFAQATPETIALQYHYITANPFPLGHKDQLNRATDQSHYSQTHEHFHESIRNYMERFGYYDIFLVEPEDGNIVYTVRKELDFGTSLKHGPMAHSNIAHAFNQAVQSENRDFIAMVDFDQYWPSYNAPAGFIASPIFDGDKKSGVVIFQFPITLLNKIMTERSGLGKTGETYLVGPDKRMRSDSFLDPTHRSVEASFRNPDQGYLNTEATTSALSGQSAAKVITDYNGNPVLSAWSPLNSAGLNWALVAEIDVSEAFVPIDKKNHTYLEQLARLYGFQDLLLINPDGHIFYSVANNSDLYTNLFTGNLRDSSLANLVGDVVKRKNYGLADLMPYAPADNHLTFFTAHPIVRDNVVELIVAVAMPENFMDTIAQRREGMGKSGETYLLGRLNNTISLRSNRTIGHGMVGETLDETLLGYDIDYVSTKTTIINHRNEHYLIRQDPLNIAGLNWSIIATISLDEIQSPIQTLRTNIILTSLILIVLIVTLAYLTAEGIVRPVKRLIQVTHNISAGNWSSRVPVTGSDEIASLGHAFNQMAQKIEQQYWLKSHIARFPNIMQKANTLDRFSQDLILALTPLLSGGHGVFYLFNENSDHFELLGNFCYPEQDGVTTRFKAGEGLAGRAVLEKKIITLEEIPANHINIGYGVGQSKPLSVVAVPLPFGDKILGVIEIAAFKRFSEIEITLLEELSLIIGLNLENMRRSHQTEALLKETQHQASMLETQTQELETQQEELRQTNEALEKHANALKQSEEALKVQEEELRATNEALSEKNQDLAKQKKQIQIASENLERSSQYKSEFLASMSHELRTPLNSLLILASSFAKNEEQNLTENQVKAASIIHESGQDLLTLINELLDLAKIEAGKIDLYPDDMILSLLFEGLKRQFQPMADQKNIALRFQIDAGLPSVIHTDIEKVQRVIKNFLSNAIKFTSEGSVTVHIHASPDQWQSLSKEIKIGSTSIAISVTDTGIGIPEEKQQLVFDAFQQADGSTSRNYGGTGLGLAISTQLAQLLGGEILLSSKENQGSTFTLIIPTLAETESEPTTAVSASTPIQHTVKPVQEVISVPDDRSTLASDDQIMLIIEDDKIFAEILRDQANERGFKCLIATSGEMGIKLAEHYKPLGIILDIGLPDMDGWSVMEKLKEQPDIRHIPIHIISGMEKQLDGLLMGAIGHLTKPVSKEQLSSVFDRIMHFSDSEVRTLLLVEDDPASQMATQQLIKGRDIEITVAETGTKALELLKTTPFDLMILDLGLPDISGFALLDNLANDKTIVKPPVIIYSGRALSREEFTQLKKYTNSIVIKGVKSPERLLDEVVLFLHRMVGTLPKDQRLMLRKAYDQETTLKGKSVLVVDDDMRNTFALARTLELKGMKVHIAPDGAMALATLETKKEIDIVLMDIMMPGMDGYETMQAIRKIDRLWKLPIIALTAKAMPEDRAKSLEAGANDYLTKPVDIDRLLSMLRVWLYQ
ncbi:MAG: response regulator [Magnetococcales bacterium]|nr:response regulator [Magnetococcales bacterium]